MENKAQDYKGHHPLPDIHWVPALCRAHSRQWGCRGRRMSGSLPCMCFHISRERQTSSRCVTEYQGENTKAAASVR